MRIQSDRGQHVITTGPYRWIRHPGYLAGIVIMVARCIALGSWLAAAILIVVSLPFLLHRASLIRIRHIMEYLYVTLMNLGIDRRNYSIKGPIDARCWRQPCSAQSSSGWQPWPQSLP